MADERKLADALDLLVVELRARLSDPDFIKEMSTGELTQAAYALLAVRDSPENLKLKKQLAKLKKRFGDGKTGKKKAHRWQTGSRKPQARRQEQDPEACGDA